MHKDPVCGNGPALSRRALLSALPASGLALAVTPPAEAEEQESEILHMFRRHQSILEKARLHTFQAIYADEDQELEQLFYRHTDRLEADMIALPSRSAADMAAKFLVATNGGECILSVADPVFAEARRLTCSVGTECSPAPTAPTPIQRRLHDWIALRDKVNYHRGPDEEIDALTDELFELEDDIMSMPTTCIADLLRKMVCHTCGFVFDIDEESSFVFDVMAELGLPHELMRT
jgi:hypothetical protein